MLSTTLNSNAIPRNGVGENMSEIIKEYKFPEDRFEALKEAQRVSGLNQSECDGLLKAFSKGFEGKIGFGQPDEFSVFIRVSALVLRLTFDFDMGLLKKRLSLDSV